MKPILAFLFAAMAAASPSYAPDFRDIAAAAGLTDAFPNGGMKTKEYIIETTGSGVAMVDVDNDGLLDIFRGCHFRSIARRQKVQKGRASRQ